MTTLLLTHPACLEHDTGELHPECADRLRAIARILEHEDFFYLERDEAPEATAAQLERAHPASHIARVLAAIPATDYHEFDADTVVSPGSGAAALRAAGAVCAAVDQVMGRRCRNVFCAVRPPGHHAGRETVEGFCLFSNAAIGALHAQAAHGLERVAVIDFDVHHGNGTQQVLWDRAGMFYASTHQADTYPYTGATGEQGPPGGCVVVNLPLPPGSGPAEFRAAWSDTILPRLRDFAPDLIVISAGFDGHAADPLAQWRLQVNDFDWLTRQVMDIAARCCESRVVSVLEGGYDTRALAACTAAHIRALMEG
jgi:acetoin utilization deacetylase AcuC-like enzyme